MKTRNEVRTCVIKLVADQLGTTPDQITDETCIPDINSLMLDAASELNMTARITDVQHFLTVGDAIEAFTN